MGAPDEVLTKEWRDLEEARLKLARLRVEDAGSIERAYRQAVTIAGTMLSVGRVGVWALDLEHSVLRCVCLRDLDDPAREEELPSLPVRELGAYERALVSRRLIAADDVASDPFTKDIVAEYFAPLGISATLDAPFYRDGRVAGVVCHEHRGAPRRWTDRDASFAATVADVVGSLALSNQLIHATSALCARELALEQSLRNEAVARIARAVAHDLGNLLSVISLTGELIERRGDSAEVRKEAVETIHQATDSAMRLSRQLLAVAGRPETSGVTSVLDDAIRQFAPALRGLAGSDRALEVDLGQPGAVVALDQTQIEQIVINLVVNAREATGPGGHIRVRTRAAPSSAPVASVVLEVSDDGMGMDERTRARVFDPYFSTKDGTQNAGLGLATVRGIVLSVGGEPSVISAPGEGASFALRLPIKAGALA